MWRPGLRRAAGRGQVWISETERGLITGWRLQPGFARGLWGPDLAFASGRVRGPSSGFGRGLRGSSGLVRGLGLELELIFESEGSEWALQPERMRTGAWG